MPNLLIDSVLLLLAFVLLLVVLNEEWAIWRRKRENERRVANLLTEMARSRPFDDRVQSNGWQSFIRGVNRGTHG